MRRKLSNQFFHSVKPFYSSLNFILKRTGQKEKEYEETVTPRLHDTSISLRIRDLDPLKLPG